jgi:hypothetical protein
MQQIEFYFIYDCSIVYINEALICEETSIKLRVSVNEREIKPSSQKK